MFCVMPRNIMRGMAAFNQVCQRFGVKFSNSAARTKPATDPQQLLLSDSRRFLRMSATQRKPKTWQRISVSNWRLATLDRMILQNQLVLTAIIVQPIDTFHNPTAHYRYSQLSFFTNTKSSKHLHRTKPEQKGAGWVQIFQWWQTT